MIGSQVITSLGIGGISTGLYLVFTKDDRNPHKDRKQEALSVFTIIMIVAFFILFITSGNSESIIVREMKSGSGGGPMNTKPPF